MSEPGTQHRAAAGPRLEPIPPAEFSSEQLELHARIAGGARAQGIQHFPLTRDDGALLGPFNAFLLSPELGTALQELGAAVRYRTSLSDRVRELAILLVAARWGSAFERAAHEAVGRAIGLTEQELHTVAQQLTPELEDPVEQASLDLVQALLAGDIDDETWAAAASVVSAETVFELATLVGYYSTIALQLRIFRVDSPQSS